jgi:group I intron endonuclease
MHVSGVYEIRNVVNGKVYVGSAAYSIKGRWELHRKQLRSGTHHSCHLQRAWNKYGSKTFRFKILEVCQATFCTGREQHWIDELRAADNRYGYNCSPTAGSTLGHKASEESRAKRSAMQLGRKHSPETKAKIGAAHRGMKRSESAKANMSAAAKNRSVEWRRQVSERQRRLMSDPERRAAVSRVHKGKKLSEEHKEALHSANRGRALSAEHKAKISKANREAKAIPNLRSCLGGPKIRDNKKSLISGTDEG